MALRGASARRYAEALLELALEQGELDAWRASLERATAALSGDTLRLLRSPSISLATRSKALEEATAGEPGGIRGLLFTLLERDALRLLPDIRRSFEDLIDAREGIEKAVITTAVPLAEAERQDLVARLERETGRTLRPTFRVDPAILGGALVRVGDHQVDGSLRTRLAQLRERLATS